VKKGFLHNGYRCFLEEGKQKRAHVRIVEDILGHRLGESVEVHHVNSDRSDNRHENLVVCPDAAYHHLLHRRTRAYDACGHADWVKCKFCKQWDDPKNVYMGGGLPNIAHRTCATKYRRIQRARLVA
jgi:hypothetical protein